SKYDTNLMVLEKKKFSLEQLLTEVLEQFGQKLEEKKLTIDYHPVESSMIWADKKKIIQVLINILSNSIRHAYPGSAISIIFIEHSDTLEVQIANKGQSIPENQLERVWEQFYRIDSSRDRKLGGTGLGLAIVSQILQLH
ncbi:sensor histidine kinase, partial [Paraburkholderia sp. BR14264]|uniref:sensor histidine kinase n=1 Tax=Paraburkholderia sp. BR14264 TaxID=3237001 RepID=UPI00397912B1